MSAPCLRRNPLQMKRILRRFTVFLLLVAVYRAPIASAKELQTSSTGIPTGSTSIGSVAVGCSLCRDSGNCSVAMNDTTSGVFCGDLHTSVSTTQACCCSYYTECRITSKSRACECGGESFTAQFRHERLSSTEGANKTDPLPVQDSYTSTSEAYTESSEMPVSTEILLHLSAYLALFVFAMYVDQWVECFSDFRRNQMVAYSETVEMKMLRFRQRFSKRQRESKVDTDTDDNLPLLMLQSPAPTSSPVFTFPDNSDVEVPTTNEQNAAMHEEVVVVTVPVQYVEEVSVSRPECPTEMHEISLE